MSDASDTLITGVLFLNNQLDNIIGTNNLWSYHSQGIINGVPVRDLDKDLNIDKLTLINNAFQITSDIKVWSGWLSPEYPKDLIKYQLIKQLLVDNKCIILLNQIQYSSSKDAYLILLTYALILYALNDRYSFYKLELKDE